MSINKYHFQADLGALYLDIAKTGDYTALGALQNIAANIALLLDERDEALKGRAPCESAASETAIMGTLGN